MEDSVGTVCWRVNSELIPQTLRSSEFGMLYYGDLVSAKTGNKICHLCRLLYFPSNIMLFSVAFTTILLIVNHLYLTFASPTVSKGGVAAGQSFNLTHSLVKRAEIPSDQKCRQPSDWVGRSCIIQLGDEAWTDKCLGDDHVIYWRLGICPPNTMCTNTFILPETITIVCIDRPSGITDTGANQQTGVAELGAGSEPAREHIVSIPVLNPISGASVSAVIEGT